MLEQKIYVSKFLLALVGPLLILLGVLAGIELHDRWFVRPIMKLYRSYTDRQRLRIIVLEASLSGGGGHTRGGSRDQSTNVD